MRSNGLSGRWGRRVVVFVGLLSFCLVSAESVEAGWMNFQNDTATRLIASPAISTDDSEEKDYAWGDLDQDGDVDLIAVRKKPYSVPGGRRNILFMNEGVGEGHAVNGVFVDRTSELAPELLDLTNDRDVAVVDVDNDGWLDVVTATTISDGLPKSISHPRVYMNLGSSGGVWLGLAYEEPRIPQLMTVSGIPVAPRFCSVGHGDVTGDGFEDLYFGDYDDGSFGFPENNAWDLDDRLLVNQGDGTFVDETAARMDPSVNLSAFGMAAAIVDMNNDGMMDIVRDTALQNPTHVSIAYNGTNGGGDQGYFPMARRDVVYSASPYHIWVGNLNNDEWNDIVVTDDGFDRYLIGTGLGADNMLNFSSQVLQGSASFEFGGNNIIVDLDNDGWNDVIVGSIDVDDAGFCNANSYAYRNLANPPIVTLTTQDGNVPWIPRGIHDVAVFDFNGDGWNDIFVGTCNASAPGTAVWINTGFRIDFSFPGGAPTELVPGVNTPFMVDIDIDAAEASAPVAGSFLQHVSIDGGPFVATELTDLGGGSYAGNLMAEDCPSVVSFYVSVESQNGDTFFFPEGGPSEAVSLIAAFGTDLVFEDRFESASPGWTVENTALSAGAWTRVNPNGTTSSGDQAQPEDDAGSGADTMCYITQQSTGGQASNNDVDGGPTILTSPVLDMSGGDAIIAYDRWQFTSTPESPDVLETQVSNGGPWVSVTETGGTNGLWESNAFRVGAFVTPTSTVQVRFVSSDNPNNSITESGVDNFVVLELTCSDESGPAVVHGLPGVSIDDQAFGGYIDARRESSNGVDLNNGIDEVVIGFTESVFAIGGGPVTAGSFTLSETGGGAAPNVTDVTMLDDNTARLTLDRALTIQEWLTVAANVEDATGNPITSLGNQGPGLDEPDRVDIGFLPGDVDQDGGVGPFDLLRFRQLVNDVVNPDRGVEIDYVDINRDGALSPFDLLAFRQLINGVNPATRAWSGESMNNARP